MRWNWRAARGCEVQIDWASVPLLAGVRALAGAGLRHRRLGPQLGRLRRRRGAARRLCRRGPRAADRPADQRRPAGGGFTGAVPTLWCTLRGLDRDVQRAVIQHFNLAMLGLTTVAYLQRGLITTAHLPDLGVVTVALLLPALLGMRLYTRISAVAFRNTVLGLLTASGLAMLAATLPQLFR
jgi:hypothetical protein